MNIYRTPINRKPKVFLLLTLLLLSTLMYITNKKKTVRKIIKIQPKTAKMAVKSRGPTKHEGHKGKWYEPTWEDLDSRPLPEWFDRAKIGIFVHWGVYSVPAIYTEWIWYRWKTDAIEGLVKYMKRNFKPNFTYEEFAPFFKAQLFDPHEWARLFAKSGAKYVVFTSKHHDGYAMFPSKQSPGWNSVDVGPRRDIVGDLGAAVRLKGLRYGLYYSLYEWYNPDYLWDKSKRFTTSKYVDRKLWPDVKQLVNDYKPSIVWFDGHWEAPHTYFNTTRILSWLYNESPVKEYVVVNDRLGKGESCHHGDFFNCKDKYMPRALVKHKWETCLSLDLASWGYRTNMQEDDVMSVNTMFKLLIQTISNGGNFLINIGPTKDGVIVPIFRKRLLELGKWLETNGEAVYNSSPWLYQQDRANKEVFYTCVKAVYNANHPTAIPSSSDAIKAIYALFTEYPKNYVLELKGVASELTGFEYEIKMLGHHEILNWSMIDKGDVVAIQLPENTELEHAWALKFYRKNL